MKAVEVWHPYFQTPYQVGALVPIDFTLTLDHINHLDGSDLNFQNHAELLKNKIVLFGYIGPFNEDKHFTPIRNIIQLEADQSDTYGVVIIANQIRMLLKEE